MTHIEKLLAITAQLSECNSYLPKEIHEINIKINHINQLGDQIIKIGGDISKETLEHPAIYPEYVQAVKLFNSKRLALVRAVNKYKKEQRRVWLSDAVNKGTIVITETSQEDVKTHLAEEEFKAQAEEAHKSPQQLYKESMQSFNYALKKRKQETHE